MELLRTERFHGAVAFTFQGVQERGPVLPHLTSPLDTGFLQLVVERRRAFVIFASRKRGKLAGIDAVTGLDIRIQKVALGLVG